MTGGGQGLGRAMALALADAGARVVLVDLNADKLSKVADEIDRHVARDRALSVVADITKRDDCKRVLEKSLATFGAAEVLVNNARHLTQGYPVVPFWEADPDFWQNTIRTNVNGMFLMSHTITPHLVAQGWGRIINISTSLGTLQRIKNSPYGVSKAAIEAATVIWAKDLEGTGVTVNSLLPGGRVDTGEGEVVRWAGDKMLPVDIMNPLIIWLASDLSHGKTGGRYVGKNWDPSLSPNEAAEKAREAVVFETPPPETR